MVNPFQNTGSAPCPRRVGCVSYFNAKPLIVGLDQLSPGVQIRYDVPSRLLGDLLEGQVDVALCPVVDYFRSPVPLQLLRSGGIGSRRQTLTVRLFSQCPIEQVQEVYADSDSSTSAMLLHVVLKQLYQRDISLIRFDARQAESARPPRSMLLIGDKVVTRSPKAITYPYQLDLGEAWAQWTGLPFVFAIWMTRNDTDLGNLPALLNQTRQANASRGRVLVEQFAEEHGWPGDLAQHYLEQLLQYHIGPEQEHAITRFGEALAQQNLIDQTRPLTWYPADQKLPVIPDIKPSP